MIRRNVELSWFQEQYRLWILFSVDYAIVIDRRVEEKNVNAKIYTLLFLESFRLDGIRYYQKF